MDIQDLVGFTLESCRFSKSSYTFEFCGFLNSEYKTFLVSTSYNFSRTKEKLVDAGKTFSLEAWALLEKKLVSISIHISEQSPEAIFYFEGNDKFIVYSDEPLVDNLLIVTDQETGNWYPVS